MLKLQFRDQPGNFVKLSVATLTLGRDEGNDVVLDSPSVSDFHAEITADARQHWIVDLLSANGTWVNEQRITQPSPLKAWDVIRLGSVELEVTDPSSPQPQDWALRAESDLLASQFHNLQERTVVGRAPDCDLTIEGSMLSREHAELVIEIDHLRVTDLDSSNGTYLNGERIRQGRAYPGDELRFDEQTFVVIGPRRSSPVGAGSVAEKTVVRATVPDEDILSAALDQPPELEVPPAPEFSAAPEVSVVPEESPASELSPNAELSLEPEALPEAEDSLDLEVQPGPEVSLAPDAEPGPEISLEPEVSSGPEVQPEGNVEQIAPNADDETQLFVPAPPPSFLLELNTSGAPRRIALDQHQYTLGRSPECDGVLEESSISKRHAEFSYYKGVWSVRDLGSSNGILLNGDLVIDASLAPGDRLLLGRLEFEFGMDAESMDNHEDVTRIFAASADSESPRVPQVDSRGAHSRGRRLFGIAGIVLVSLLVIAGFYLVTGNWPLRLWE